MPDNIILQSKDWYLGILFFLLILFASFWYRRTHLQHSPFKKFFIAAILCRVVSAVIFGLMYQFLYKYGDTFGYHKYAEDIYNSFFSDPLEVIRLYFTGVDNITRDSPLYDIFINFYNSSSVAITTKLIGFIGLFTNNSYVANGMIMSCLSFIGCWKIFRLFSNLYPSITRGIALVVLFLPSVFFWSSGVAKEPFCLLGLGLVVESMYFLLIAHTFRLKYLLEGSLGIFLLVTIKPYILLALMVGLIPWVIIRNIKMIKSELLKYSVIGFIVVSVVTTIIILDSVEGIDDFNGIPLNVELLQERLKTDAYNQAKATEDVGGSGYEIPAFGFSFGDMANMLLFGINVTYYRPYVWEIKKPVVIPLALESLFNLCFTIFVIFRAGILRFIKYLFINPDVLFCMTYALILGSVVGIESSNFGTLVRFKAPCASFYLLGLLIIYYEAVLKKKKVPH